MLQVYFADEAPPKEQRQIFFEDEQPTALKEQESKEKPSFWDEGLPPMGPEELYMYPQAKEQVGQFFTGAGRGFVAQTQVPALLGRRMKEPETTPETVGNFVGRFVETAAELVGAGVLLRKVGMPAAKTLLSRMSRGALVLGAQEAGQQIRKGAAEMIYDGDYGYEGGTAVLESIAIGALFGAAEHGVATVWRHLKPTEQAEALKILGLKKGAAEDEIAQAVRELSKKYHPDKVAGMREKFEQVIAARETLRNVKSGVIKRAGPAPISELGEGAPVKAPESQLILPTMDETLPATKEQKALWHKITRSKGLSAKERGDLLEKYTMPPTASTIAQGLRTPLGAGETTPQGVLPVYQASGLIIHDATSAGMSVEDFDLNLSLLEAKLRKGTLNKAALYQNPIFQFIGAGDATQINQVFDAEPQALLSSLRQAINKKLADITTPPGEIARQTPQDAERALVIWQRYLETGDPAILEDMPPGGMINISPEQVSDSLAATLSTSAKRAEFKKNLNQAIIEVERGDAQRSDLINEVIAYQKIWGEIDSLSLDVLRYMGVEQMFKKTPPGAIAAEQAPAGAEKPAVAPQVPAKAPTVAQEGQIPPPPAPKPARGVRSTTKATRAQMDKAIRQIQQQETILDATERNVVKSATDKDTAGRVEAYLSDRAKQLGERPMPRNPDLRRHRLRNLRIMARRAKRATAIDIAKAQKGDQPKAKLSPWQSSFNAIMNLEEKVLRPLWTRFERMYWRHSQAKRRAMETLQNALKTTKGQFHVQGMSYKENELIADYLFSAESRQKAIDRMRPEILEVAQKLQGLLQDPGPIAKTARKHIFHKWRLTGEPPPDIEKYGDPKEILKEGKLARAEGRLDEWLDSQKWGLRAFYYMTDAQRADSVSDVMNFFSEDFLKERKAGARRPGAIVSEARPRKAKKPQIKKGSVINNILNHYQRMEVANAIIDDLEAFYGSLKGVELSGRDKNNLRQLFDNMLLKGQSPPEWMSLPMKVKRLFWRRTLSLAIAPESAMRMSLRNAFQDIALGGPVGNTKELAKTVATLPVKGFDPEFRRHFAEDFTQEASQRYQYYKEFLLMDEANISRDISPYSAARKAGVLLDRTSELYGLVDEGNRAGIYMLVYHTNKRIARQFLDGKISARQFWARTNLDTLKISQQMEIEDALDKGDVNAIARKSALWWAFNTNFGYETALRAMVEQTPEGRIAMGIYTYPRGVFELMYQNGVRPMIEGAQTGDWGRSRRGFKNVVKILLGSLAAKIALLGIAGSTTYDILANIFGYSPIDPGVNQMIEMIDILNHEYYMWSSGQKSLSDAVKTAGGAAAVRMEMYLPFSGVVVNIYEAANDKKGVTFYSLVKKHVLKTADMAEKEFKTAERTAYQAFIHALIGGYEHTPEVEYGYGP